MRSPTIVGVECPLGSGCLPDLVVGVELGRQRGIVRNRQAMIVPEVCDFLRGCLRRARAHHDKQDQVVSD